LVFPDLDTGLAHSNYRHVGITLFAPLFDDRQHALFY